MTTSPGNYYMNDISAISDKDDRVKPSYYSYSIDEAKIEKYIKILEYEIKKHHFSMDQRCFIENIIEILNSLSQVLLLP